LSIHLRWGGFRVIKEMAVRRFFGARKCQGYVLVLFEGIALEGDPEKKPISTTTGCESFKSVEFRPSTNRYARFGFRYPKIRSAVATSATLAKGGGSLRSWRGNTVALRRKKSGVKGVGVSRKNISLDQKGEKDWTVKGNERMKE